MFVAHFEDGSTLSEKESMWDNLPADKSLTSLQLVLPRGGVVTLKNYDHYYFSNVAFVKPGQTITGVHSKIIGGVDEKLDAVFEIEVDANNNINTRRFPVAKCEIVQRCWKKGIR